MRRGLVAAAVAAALVCSLSTVLAVPSRLPAAPRADRVDYHRVLQDEAYWISTAQLTCPGSGRGAIAEARISGTDPVSVHPYEANLAARALLVAGPRYVPMVRDYLGWYLRHLNRPDHHGLAGTSTTTTTTRAPAPERRQPHPVTGDVAQVRLDRRLRRHLPDPGRRVRAGRLRRPGVPPFPGRAGRPGPGRRRDRGDPAPVRAVRRRSGLPGRVPDGQRRGETRARGLRRPAAHRARRPGGGRAPRPPRPPGCRAIEAHLWVASGTGGMYGWAADELDPSWDVWFPDSVAQVWPVFDGPGDDRRRRALWAGFTGAGRCWTHSTPAYGAVAAEHDPERRIAYAAARIGDRAAVDEYLLTASGAGPQSGRPPPWTVDDAGFRALAAYTWRSPSPTRSGPVPDHPGRSPGWSGHPARVGSAQSRPRIRWPATAVEGFLA